MLLKNPETKCPPYRPADRKTALYASFFYVKHFLGVANFSGFPTQNFFISRNCEFWQIYNEKPLTRKSVQG